MLLSVFSRWAFVMKSPAETRLRIARMPNAKIQTKRASFQLVTQIRVVTGLPVDSIAVSECRCTEIMLACRVLDIASTVTWPHSVAVPTKTATVTV